MPPQTMPLWHIDYFELQLLKKQMQEGHTDPPLPPSKQKINLPCERYFPYIRRVEDILITRNREFTAQKAI